MNEEWKPVNFMNFGNYYEVSNLGNVRSLHSKNYHNIVASYANNTTGYMAVGLNADGFHKTVTVHRLVALAFIPQVEGKLYVNHKDENKHNNRVDNLEWCTQKYNVNYGTARQRGSVSALNNDTDKKVPVVLTKGDVTQEFKSLRTASRFLGVTHSTLALRLDNPETMGNVIKGWTVAYKDSKRVINNNFNKSVKHGTDNPLHTKTQEEVEALVAKDRPNLTMIGEFSGTKKPALFRCSTCGNVFRMLPYSIYGSTHYNCPKCSIRANAEKRTITQEDAQAKLDKYFKGNLTIIDNYSKMSDPCTVKCNNCGKTVTKSLTTLFQNIKKDNYSGNGCEHCAKSRNITIRNLRRYNHTDDEILEALHKKGLDWNLNLNA